MVTCLVLLYGLWLNKEGNSAWHFICCSVKYVTMTVETSMSVLDTKREQKQKNKTKQNKKTKTNKQTKKQTNKTKQKQIKTTTTSTSQQESQLVWFEYLLFPINTT